MNAAELISLWSRPNESPATDQNEPDEALWEYWRRVAEGVLEFELALFSEALAQPLQMRTNIVGELARRGRLPPAACLAARRVLNTLPADVAEWARAQLNAREALMGLRAGVEGRGLMIDALLHKKGVAWAAVEAVALLSADECEFLVSAVHSQGFYTRAQRQQLRTAADQRAPQRYNGP